MGEHLPDCVYSSFFMNIDRIAGFVDMKRVLFTDDFFVRENILSVVAREIDLDTFIDLPIRGVFYGLNHACLRAYEAVGRFIGSACNKLLTNDNAFGDIPYQYLSWY